MKKTIFIIAFFSMSCALGMPAFAQSLSAFGLPAVTSVEELNGETTYSLSLQILMLMTALTVLPSLVLGMTAFTRIIIVLSILRQALGTQQTPPNQVLIAVALFLSFYVMSPIFEVLYVETLSPYLDGKLELNIALSVGPRLLGINNRDLTTFEVDKNLAIELAKQISKDVIVVSESGISSRKDILSSKEQGIHSFLIGESFMRAPSPGKALREILV